MKQDDGDREGGIGNFINITQNNNLKNLFITSSTLVICDCFMHPNGECVP